MRPLRVVITVPSLAGEFGGPSVKARRLGHELGQLGTLTTLVSVGRAPGAIGLPRLASFHGTPIPGRLGPLSAAIARADVVHVLGYRDPLGTAAAGLARRRRLSYLLEPVGMHRRRLRSATLKSAFDRAVGHRLISRAAGVIATSRLEAAELLEDGVPAERIHVRPNGVGLEDLLPLPPRGSLRRREGIPADVPVILALGRIARKKGLLHFAQALAALDGVWGLVCGPDAGDGTLRELLQLRQRLGLGSRMVVVPNGIWGDQKREAFADADAFCMPSASENFGNAAAEAAACGLPVVLSDQCGAAEWLDPRATVVVPYAAAGALVQALHFALRSQAFAAAAREAAAGLSRSLAWSEVARRQLAIYRRALAGLDQAVTPSQAAGQDRRELPWAGRQLASRHGAARRPMTPRW